MQQKFLVEELRKISDSIKCINEDDINNTNNKPKNNEDNLSNDNDEDANDTGDESDVASDAHADASVADMMTHEKRPEKLEGSVAVKNLAGLLGIENTQLFVNAFNALRAGKIPNNQTQVRELAIAFYRLLAADASTTSKVLSQLRRIHKVS